VVIAESPDIEGVVKFPSTVRAGINLAFEYPEIIVTPKVKLRLSPVMENVPTGQRLMMD
jgi:hypothetical protein